MNFLDTLTYVHEHSFYPIIIKTVVPIDERFMKITFFHLQKYKLREIGDPYKTIIHKYPQDFGHLDYAEVYILKAKLGLPIAPHLLRQELATLLKIPLEDIVVKMEYEGLEQNHDFINIHKEIERKAKELGLERSSNLSTDPHYRKHESPVPQEIMAGNHFIETFKKFQAEKLKNSQPKKFRSKNTDKLFSYILDNEEKSNYENDYNKNIKDAPKIYPKDKNYELPSEELEVEKELVGNWGNFWKKTNYSKPFKTPDGKEVEVYHIPDALEILRKKYNK